MPTRDPDLLLDQQLAYYRAMAPHYDETAQRDVDEIDRPELESALAQFGPTGDVLELAGGTEHWTVSLARYANSLTVLDASEEMLVINQAKSAGAARRVDYLVADLFDWQPARRYDVAFFSFWLSHVPPGRFETFWQLVDHALQPGGRVLFIDDALPRSEPHNHGGWDDPEHRVSLRQLNDGRQYNIVKLYSQPAASSSVSPRWALTFRSAKTTHGYCICGQGRRQPDS